MVSKMKRLRNIVIIFIFMLSGCVCSETIKLKKELDDLQNQVFDLKQDLGFVNNRLIKQQNEMNIVDNKLATLEDRHNKFLNSIWLSVPDSSPVVINWSIILGKISCSEKAAPTDAPS